MQVQQRTMTRVGTTPAVPVHPASRELARPIQRSITRHSPMQVVSQKCLQPPDPTDTPPQRPTKPNQPTARSERI